MECWRYTLEKDRSVFKFMILLNIQIIEMILNNISNRPPSKIINSIL